MEKRNCIHWALWIVVAPFILFFLLCFLIYLPPIQNYLVDKAASVASARMGMRISIGHINLSFPLNVRLSDVTAIKNEKDTILNIGILNAKVKMLPLLRKHIEVDGITLSNGILDSQDFIDGMCLKGKIGRLYLTSHGINLNREEAVVNKLSLDDSDIYLCLNDTSDENTAKTEIPWKIKAKDIIINRTGFSMVMPQDTLILTTYLDKLSLKNGNADFHKGIYQLSSFNVQNSKLGYSADTNLSDSLQIALSNLNMQLDSVYYHGRDMMGVVNKLNFKERSGLELTSASGRLISDENTISISDLNVVTANSSMEMLGNVDWSAIKGDKDARVSARLMADIGKPDVMLMLKHLDYKIIEKYPAQPLRVRLGADGTMNLIHVATLTAELPTAFDISAGGTFSNLTDSINRVGNIKLRSKFHDVHFISSLTGGYTIPEGSGIDGEFQLRGTRIGLDALLTTAMQKIALANDTTVLNDSTFELKPVEYSPSATLVAKYDWEKNIYSAVANIDRINLHEFMPNDSLFTVSANLKLDGQGTDIYSGGTHINFDGTIDKLRYGSYNLTNMQLSGKLTKHQLTAIATADNDLIRLQAGLDGQIKRNDITAELNLDVNNLNWQVLHLTDIPVSTSHRIKAILKTDMRKLYVLDANLSGTTIYSQGKTYKAKDLWTKMASSKDSTNVCLRTGDLNLDLMMDVSIEDLPKLRTQLMTEINNQWKKKDIHQVEWMKYFPSISLKFVSGKDNPIHNYLKFRGCSYSDLALDLQTSSVEGILGTGHIYGLKKDTFMLDSITFNLNQDSAGIHLLGQVESVPKKAQDAFTINLTGWMNNNNGKITLEYLNAKKEVGAYLGAETLVEADGVNIHLFPEHPTFLYRKFTLNEDNFIYYNNGGRIGAEVNLHDDKGVGIQFYSNHSDSLAQQDMTLELNQVNLDEFRRVFPYMPDMKGIIEGTGHYIVKEKKPMFSVDIMMQDFVYEGSKLGNWEANAVYLPGERNDHHVDGFILHEGEEISHINGIYLDAKEGMGAITADVDFEHFPLFVLNPFIPDKLVEFTGDVNGTLSAKGIASNPKLNGQLTMDSVVMVVPEYSARFNIDNRKLEVKDSKLVLADYKITTAGKNPMTVNGTVDMTKLSAVNLDLRLRANNYELFNAPKTKRALTYGKMYVDLTAFLRGPVDNLIMRGNMNVLGNTDFTYIMKDSPLTVNDRLGELVTFVNFNDATENQIPEKEVIMSGIDILLAIHIDQAVQCHVDLNEDGSNYMLLEGGGDLQFQYTPEGEMRLNGRYSLNSGEMKYEIPVIPLRTFNIQSGSYLEWMGEMMNPRLNITATERVRARVSSSSESQRMVNFDVGVKLSQTLEALGMTFILSSPDDASVQNELATLSEEAKSRLAVTMLVTGTYMAESNTSSKNFDATNALNSFLQSEISSIVGKSMDINFGVETLDDDRGRHTDYNFQFARRFWNNRVRIVIGGTVTTGTAATQRESFIDNVSIEYRLDNSGMRYLKLFHDRNYESVLEGEVVETGIGLVWRRKVDKLTDLFIFRKRKNEE
ncbi:MAG: translocation/assembly module TamB domain-containing protein [Phocaeicola sp.]|uniref:translocation/assembly module TamB domain-containing protein n=1 Tax=Phocaeicola sp. TaxID=2773926 RepID=UPI003F9F4363